MPQTDEQQIEDLVVRLVEALARSAGQGFERFEVFFQHTGQYPYRTHFLDETYPTIGLAVGEPLGDLRSEIATSVAGEQWGDDS